MREQKTKVKEVKENNTYKIIATPLSPCPHLDINQPPPPIPPAPSFVTIKWI